MVVLPFVAQVGHLRGMRAADRLGLVRHGPTRSATMLGNTANATVTGRIMKTTGTIIARSKL